MQVSLPIGLLIIVACFSTPAVIVYLVHRVIKYLEWRNHEPVVEIENIYDKDGELETQITKIDGVPRMIVGRFEGGF